MSYIVFECLEYGRNTAVQIPLDSPGLLICLHRGLALGDMKYECPFMLF